MSLFSTNIVKLLKFAARPGEKFRLADHDPSSRGHFQDKAEAKEKVARDVERLAELQDVFYASSSYALLIIFQAMDAAGKDGAIKHVMRGLNPQGCHVASFQAPSPRELAHDYLWRCYLSLPPRGHIGIFNRSYYEEVLVVRVHPELLQKQALPGLPRDPRDVWAQRYRQMNALERHLTENGTRIVKFFLHLSKDEQKRRFLERINNPAKNWKFSAADLRERAHWDKYMQAYEEMIEATSTDHAPWYIIPADHKWFSRALIAEILVQTLESLELHYPKLDDAGRAALEEARQLLENEN